MLRQLLVEQISRLIHNGFAPDDSDITDNLINQYINQGIAVAAKNNYKESIQLDGIGYVNNSFYTTFKGIAITADEEALWTLQLPSVPVSVGKNEGVSRLLFKNKRLNLSYDAIPISTNDTGFVRSVRKIPDKVLYYIEGGTAKVISALNMTEYTANVTLISGGDANNLNSQLNVPDDVIPQIIDYCMKLLAAELNMKSDVANDGVYKP